ncbi:PLP-dependent aminotransferase family protein [Novosphingobium sp.]|uniref:aminotransferase-like domain-containing protein n=1 Tax=Novosphingobium sp. TaxID=1874826 RepID=UPI0035B07E3C
MTHRPKKVLRPFSLDKSNGLCLQDQVRRGIINLVLARTWPFGYKLPSSRALAELLGVSRNTVSLAYQRLVADGYLSAVPRSGLFVAMDLNAGLISPGLVAGGEVVRRETDSFWADRLGRGGELTRSPDWRRFAYPLVDSGFDSGLFPAEDWREATTLSLKRGQIISWAGLSDDDPVLIDEIRNKVLPRRGIYAQPDEILLTLGAQQARALCMDLLCRDGARVAVEEPGQPEIRVLAKRLGATLLPMQVDSEGLVPNERLRSCDVLVVTPSHQLPTGATLAANRRTALMEMLPGSSLVIVEDDFESETNYLDEPQPALRSFEHGGRVIYIASLNKLLDPNICLGFIVADAPVIARLRELRRLGGPPPPVNNQRAAAQFLALGHYDRMMRRLAREFHERMLSLRDALNHYMPRVVEIEPPRGGTTLWVRGPAGLDIEALAELAHERGVLFERVEPYYAGTVPAGLFRLGVSCIAKDRIRDGISELASALSELISGKRKPSGELLTHDELVRLMTGAQLGCRTIYGDPCTIELYPDGRMSGAAGFRNEDCDTGRWWIEGDRWYRQWRNWAYGEAAGFQVVLRGDVIHWVNAQGRSFDWATLSPNVHLAP